MNNQKGITTIELLISLFILAIILTASANFYEFYSTKSSNFGSFNTARNLGVSVLENQLETTKLGYKTIGEVYRKNVFIKGRKYEVVAERQDATNTTSYYNKNIPFYLIKTKVYFEDKEIEVNGYVTSE